MSSVVVKRKDVPWWLSIYYLFIGLIYIIISIIIIALQNASIQLLLDLLTFILLLLGISRLLYGIFNKDSTKLLRILKTIVGIGIIVLSSIDFYIRETNYSTQITLLAIGILILGTVRISAGFLDKKEANWYRIMLIVVGSITSIISILFLIFPGWETSIYIILLAVSFILQGLTKLNYAIRIFEKK